MSPAVQAQLLRFVQDKQFERLGEGRTRTADVRVLSATNKDLEREVREGRFREDLLYRLNVFEIVVPALRERAEDILPMVRRFLETFAKANKRGAGAHSRGRGAAARLPVARQCARAAQRDRAGDDRLAH